MEQRMSEALDQHLGAFRSSAAASVKLGHCVTFLVTSLALTAYYYACMDQQLVGDYRVTMYCYQP